MEELIESGDDWELKNYRFSVSTVKQDFSV